MQLKIDPFVSFLHPVCKLIFLIILFSFREIWGKYAKYFKQLANGSYSAPEILLVAYFVLIIGLHLLPTGEDTHTSSEK